MTTLSTLGFIARRRAARRAATLVECAAALAVIATIAALLLPTLHRLRGSAEIEGSLTNLTLLGFAHALYAADWNDRQPTPIADDLAAYGTNASVALANYCNATGSQHPPARLGWGFSDNDPTRAYTYFHYYLHYGSDCFVPLPANASLIQPIVFSSGGGVPYFGAFRLPNTPTLREYVAGRFYDETFFAPADALPLSLVEDAFDWPFEFWDRPPTPVGDVPAWSSYCWSPSGMFHPDVLRTPLDGGFVNPWSIDHGFASPSFSQALHPALKTLMLEHNWLQNAQYGACNPAFEVGSYGTDCEPWYFNHGLASAPAALFHDLSVRLLPNALVQAGDQLLIDQTGYGLWSRDTSFGADGYFNDVSADQVDLSHHVLTTDGIQGRDVLEVSGFAPPRGGDVRSQSGRAGAAAPKTGAASAAWWRRGLGLRNHE